MFYDIPDSSFVNKVFHASSAEMATITQEAKNSFLGKLANWNFFPEVEQRPVLSNLGQGLDAVTSIPSLTLIAAGGVAALYFQSYGIALAAAVSICAGRKLNIELQKVEYLARNEIHNQRLEHRNKNRGLSLAEIITAKAKNN